MRRILNATIIISSLAFASLSKAQVTDVWTATTSWDELLKANVTSKGGVDYAGFAKSKAKLLAFIAIYKNTAPAKWNDNQKKAAYINLYNAAMILHVLNYAADKKIDLATAAFTEIEINKIKVDGGNIWDGNSKVDLAGQMVNQDNIEHDLIRGQASGDLESLKVSKLDPRIHAAVNCAAISCPRVREVAYRPENVEKLLDENMKEYMSSNEQFSKVSDSKLKANQITLWYYSDFDSYGKDVLKKGGAGDYLATFIEPSAKDAEWKIKYLKANFNDRGKVSLKVSSDFDFHYNWQVNDLRNKK